MSPQELTCKIITLTFPLILVQFLHSETLNRLISDYLPFVCVHYALWVLHSPDQLSSLRVLEITSSFFQIVSISFHFAPIFISAWITYFAHRITGEHITNVSILFFISELELIKKGIQQCVEKIPWNPSLREIKKTLSWSVQAKHLEKCCPYNARDVEAVRNTNHEMQT